MAINVTVTEEIVNVNVSVSTLANDIAAANALRAEEAADDAEAALAQVVPAVNQGLQDIEDAKDGALLDIGNAESSAIGNITQAESDALSDISDAKDQAIQDVADATQDALDAANTSTQQAILSAAARDDAETARLGAENAEDGAFASQLASELARDQAVIAKDDAEDARDDVFNQVNFTGANNGDLLQRESGVFVPKSLTEALEPRINLGFSGNAVTPLPLVNGGNVTPARGNFITTTKRTLIKQVSVYAAGTTNITVQLRQGHSASGAVLLQQVFALVAGKNDLLLNFVVPIGDYTLYSGVSLTGGGAWRNDSGVSYPYTTDGFSIVGSTVTNSYYYFYDIILGNEEVIDFIGTSPDDLLQVNSLGVFEPKSPTLVNKPVSALSQSYLSGIISDKNIFAYDNFNRLANTTLLNGDLDLFGNTYEVIGENPTINANGNLSLPDTSSFLLIDKLADFDNSSNTTKTHHVFLTMVPSSGNPLFFMIYKDSTNYIIVQLNQERFIVDKVISSVTTNVVTTNYTNGNRHRNANLNARVNISRQTSGASNFIVTVKFEATNQTAIANLSTDFEVFDTYKFGFGRLSVGGRVSNYLITGK
jgi:hypothetical protein